MTLISCIIITPLSIRGLMKHMIGLIFFVTSKLFICLFFSKMAKRILCWNIQRPSRQNIFTNFSKSMNKFMPSDDGMISLLAQHFHASSTSNQSDPTRIPRMNLNKPTRPYQPRRALM